MSVIIEISETTFVERFPLLRNHLNPNATFDWGDGYGTMFETYGQEWEFVANQPVERVWTLVDADGKLVIVNGLAFVNRLGYFVSSMPWPESASIEVVLD